MKHIVKVPSNLVLEQTITFANSLRELPPAEEYVFDFGQVARFEPFSLLYLSSEIQRCRQHRKDSLFNASNYDKCSYAAHMGFFRAFGVNYGNHPGQAAGSSTYVPIHIYNIKDIKEDAQSQMIAPAKLLEKKAAELSAILTQTDQGELFKTLVYCIREVFRNVLEHSEATQFGFCAQYWPYLKKVSLAILDRGRGIREGLSTNPHLSLSTDEEAILIALEPGISGKSYEGAYQDPDDAWANSGYGLYMTSSICREGGGFFIASGSKGYFMSENKARFLDTPFQGTALNLTLNTDRLGKLQDMLTSYSKQANSSNKKPSLSSQGLMDN